MQEANRSFSSASKGANASGHYGSYFTATSASEAQLEASLGRKEMRDFQEALAERLRLAQTNPTQQSGLAFQIGGKNYVVALQQAGEIIPMPEMTPVPLTKSWYRGLANIRGNLVSIIDLNGFLGGDLCAIDKDSRIMVFADDLHFNAGLLVSHMQGLRPASQLTLASEAPHDASKPAWLGQVWRDQDGMLWNELNIAALTNDAQFLHIGVW